MFYIGYCQIFVFPKRRYPPGGQNRIVVHFPAGRQKSSLSVGTALERGETDPRQGAEDERGTTARSVSASQQSGKRISETKPERKRAKCPITHLRYANMRWTETAVLSCHQLSMAKMVKIKTECSFHYLCKATT